MGLDQKYGLQNFFLAMKELGLEVWASDGAPTENGPAKGALAIDTTNGNLYINQGTASSATWVRMSDLGASVSGSELTTVANTRVARSTIGGIANGGENNHILTAPSDCTISNVVVTSDTATSGSDGSNNYSFQVQNLTQANALLSSAVDTNGNEIAADTAFDVTPDQNASISDNDVLELQITETGTATDLTSAKVTVQVEYTVSS